VRLKDGPSAICSPADAVRSRSRLRRANYYVNVIDAVSGYPCAVASATETLVDLPRREGESPSLGRSLRQRTHGILAPAGMHALASTSGAPTRRAAGFRRSVPNWDSPRPDHCWRPQADRGDGPVHGALHKGCRHQHQETASARSSRGAFTAIAERAPSMQTTPCDRQCPGSSGTRFRRSRPAFLAQTLPVRTPMAGSRVNLCSRLTLADCRRGSCSRPCGLLTASS
jgi:hypothetical protein